MRSRIDASARAIAVCLLLIAAGLSFQPARAQPAEPSAGAQQTEPAVSAQPAEREIEGALRTAAADPNLATNRTITTLRWRRTDARSTDTPGWLRWIAGLLAWIDRSARLLVWAGAAVAAVLLLVRVLGMLQMPGVTGVDETFVAPTHVHDLDIRPESLPADIGEAARRLWDSGEHRASLSLLYRGLLSRLAHVHRIPIRESSTEGDCLALAATRLPPERQEYAARLVHVWQRLVYGHEDVQTPNVHELCSGFSQNLGGSSVTDARAIGGAA